MTSNRKQIKGTERDKLWYSTREFFRKELINWMGVKIAECHNNIRIIKPAKNASRTWQLTDRFSGISSLMKPFSVSGFCSWLLQKEQPLRFLIMLDLLNYNNISKDWRRRRRRRRSLTEGVRDNNKNKNRSLQQMQISRLLVSSDLPRRRPLLAKMRDVLDEDDVQSCRGSSHLSLVFNAWCVCVCVWFCLSPEDSCSRVWSISSPHSSTKLLMR